MRVLITGAAGNLGSLLARRMLGGPHELNLMIHQHGLPFAVGSSSGTKVFKADLGDRESLADPLEGVNCVVHFAGVLFEPHPERFLPRTNIEYVHNLVSAALKAGVRRFILVSFPHVEGESFPERPAGGSMDGVPESVHARTRLAAEKLLFSACEGTGMVPVALRPGMIYARGVLMIDAARWAARRHLLAVWKKPTWIHLLALPDFLECVVAAVEKEGIEGVYNLGDDRPLTLQQFLDRATDRWGYNQPRRLPGWCFLVVAWLMEKYAAMFKSRTPLTRDFIRIGMASYVSDTTRMKAELLGTLEYPTIDDGIVYCDEATEQRGGSVAQAVYRHRYA